MSTKTMILLSNIVTFILGIYLFFSLNKEDIKKPFMHKFFPLFISIFSVVIFLLTYINL